MAVREIAFTLGDNRSGLAETFTARSFLFLPVLCRIPYILRGHRGDLERPGQNFPSLC